MKRTFFKFSLFCLIFLLNAEVSSARDIRVKLADAGRHNINSTGEITLTDSANKSHSLGKSTALSISGGAAVSGNRRFSLPATLRSGSPMGFKGYRYRGILRITKQGELINVLNIEDYLRGVLKAEANPNWPMEYLKVQAIVSRTYAIRESLAARSREFDVTDTTSSQVYHGMSAETPRTDQAVRETKDKVLAYGNELAFTPFHSDSGGATANNADVWGRDMPYLRSVKEPMAYQSPNSSWEARISPNEVSRAVQRVTPNVGTVRDITVVNTDQHGRAVDLRITGSNSSATIRASAFRTAIGPNKLKSTFLVLPAASNNTRQVQTQQPPRTEPAQTPRAANGINLNNVNYNEAMTPQEDALLTQLFTEGAFSSSEMVEILMKPEKRKEYLYRVLARTSGRGSQTPPAPPPPPPNKTNSETMPSGASIPFSNGHFVFRGRGWGHGVGMSQYGAMNLANNGWSAERILTHYFPGTAIKTAVAR